MSDASGFVTVCGAACTCLSCLGAERSLFEASDGHRPGSLAHRTEEGVR